MFAIFTTQLEFYDIAFWVTFKINWCCFLKNLRSSQDFYTTTGRSGRAKYQLWCLVLVCTCAKKKQFMCFWTDVAKEGLEIRKWFFGVWLPRVGFHACALLAGSDLISSSLLEPARPDQAGSHPGGQFTPFLLISKPMYCISTHPLHGALLISTKASQQELNMSDRLK